MNSKIAVAFASFVLAAGCASTPVPTISLSQSDTPDISERSLVTVTQAPPPLTPMRASAAAFGALGGLAMASAANSYAKEHGVVDPASRIEGKLSSLIAEKYGAKSSPDGLDMTTAKAAQPYPTAPNTLYVDAKTYLWMQLYFPANWGRFKVMYNTLIQLVDGANGKAVAQYDCKKVSHDKADDAPTLQELEAADGPKSMNALLSKMADECLAQFEEAALGIQQAP